jgi:putative endonuclease
MKTHQYYVYILKDPTNSVLYTGVTNNLVRRVIEHKTGQVEGFTKKYNCHRLVYFEETNDVNIAIEREKQLKNWHRDWKVNLIKEQNQKWEDLSRGWFDEYSFDPETSSG